MTNKQKIEAAQKRIKELETLIKSWQNNECRKTTKTLELSNS